MQESNRHILISLIENNNIKKEEKEEALALTGVVPTTTLWYKFIDQVLLWFGALSVAFALMFFVAYNWIEFGRFAKFALLEGSLLLSVGVYYYLGTEKLSAKVTLFVSVLLLGVLLALVGQTYQTGADTWELFFYWGILMLPWVIVGRFAPLWIFWILLMNLSLLFHMGIFGHFGMTLFYANSSALWLFFIFNSVALGLWEFFYQNFEFLQSTWAVRLLGYLSGKSVTWLALSAVWDKGSFLGILAWLLWLAVIYWFYRVQKIELFMLAMACLSFSIVVVNLLIKFISWIHFDLNFILLIGLVIIGLGSVSASWLKSLQKEANNEK